MAEVYPLFRYYSLAVRDWLREACTLPRFDRVSADISSITRTGTAGGGVNQNEIHLTSSNSHFKPNQIIRLIGTNNNDEYYSISKIVDNILILDKRYRRLRDDQYEPGGTVKRAINIIYADMERAITEIAQPLRNGLVDTPGIGFYITDYQFKFEKSRPKENFYTRRYKDNMGHVLSSSRVPPLLEYQVHYNIMIWTVYMQEMDILSYQILNGFNPEKFFWIGDKKYGFDYKGDRKDREHKGQWAHALVDTITDTSDLEPGDAANRSLRTDIGFMINNAYLPMPFDKDNNIIGSLDVETILQE